MNTSELEGARLDYWVALANGVKRGANGGAQPEGYSAYVYWHDAPQNQPDSQARIVTPGIDQRVQRFSTDWAHGGPIIERENIWLARYTDNRVHPNEAPRPVDPEWSACVATSDYDSFVPNRAYYCAGPTPLIAAMRCFVCSKFGDEVPNE